MRKEKVKRNIEINISNKFLYSVIALIIVVVLGIGVYASGGTHTMGEVAPPCNGILTSSGGSWSCIPAPSTCNGANQVLHWDGSAWSCATIDSGFACNWAGWSPACVCLTGDDPSMICGYNSYGAVYPSLTNQQYCSSGYVTDTRIVYCCNSVGGECAAM